MPQARPAKKIKQFDEFIDWGDVCPSGMTTPSFSEATTPDTISDHNSCVNSPTVSCSHGILANSIPYVDYFSLNIIHKFRSDSNRLAFIDFSDPPSRINLVPYESAFVPVSSIGIQDVLASSAVPPQVMPPTNIPTQPHITDGQTPLSQQTRSLTPTSNSIYTPAVHYLPDAPMVISRPNAPLCLRRHFGVKRTHPWGGMKLRAIRSIELQALSSIREWFLYKQGKVEEYSPPMKLEASTYEARNNSFGDTICIANPDVYALLANLECKSK